MLKTDSFFTHSLVIQYLFSFSSFFQQESSILHTHLGIIFFAYRSFWNYFIFINIHIRWCYKSLNPFCFRRFGLISNILKFIKCIFFTYLRSLRRVLICHTHSHFQTLKTINHNILTLLILRIIYRLLHTLIPRFDFKLYISKVSFSLFVFIKFKFHGVLAFNQVSTGSIHNISGVELCILIFMILIEVKILNMNYINIITHDLLFLSFNLFLINNVQMVDILNHFKNVQLLGHFLLTI